MTRHTSFESDVVEGKPVTATGEEWRPGTEVVSFHQSPSLECILEYVGLSHILESTEKMHCDTYSKASFKCTQRVCTVRSSFEARRKRRVAQAIGIPPPMTKVTKRKAYANGFAIVIHSRATRTQMCGSPSAAETVGTQMQCVGRPTYRIDDPSVGIPVHRTSIQACTSSAVIERPCPVGYSGQNVRAAPQSSSNHSPDASCLRSDQD